eukprot:103067_1
MSSENTNELAAYQLHVYGNHQLLLQRNNLSQCAHAFSDCLSATNIKLVLREYNKIINDSSEYELSNKVDELINKKLFNGKYCNLNLLNDFFHIKYDHKTNDSLNKLNSFYKFLSNYGDILCDIKYCKGYKRYYRSREQLINKSENKEN